MKSLVQEAHGDLRLIDAPRPTLRPDFVLVANQCSLVSAGTERSTVERARQSLLARAIGRPDLVREVFSRVRNNGVVATLESVRSHLGRLVPLGYSSAGIVQGVGPGVSEFYIGQPVACAGGGYAVHAEYVMVPKNLCVPLPRHSEKTTTQAAGAYVSFEQACFTALGAIAMQGIRQGDARVGECVAIVGLGLVGLLTAQILHAAGCKVMGIDLNPERVAVAQKLGVEPSLICGSWDDQENREAVVGAVHAATRGRGADVVIITAATQASGPVHMAGALCRDRGRIVIVGDVKVDVPRDLYYEREINIYFSRSYGPGRYDSSYEEGGIDYPLGHVRWTEKRNMEAFLDLLASERIDLRALITHRFAIDNASCAYDLLTGKTPDPYVGIVLTYPHPTTLQQKPVCAPASRPGGREELRVSCIGAGAFALSILLPKLRRCSGVVFRGIAARRPTSARFGADQFGFDFATCDYREILADGSTDAVVIATRHDSHAQLVAEAITSGKDIFVEKPLCLTEDQLRHLVQTYRSHGRGCRSVTVGFNRRFAPLAVRMREFFRQRRSPMVLQYSINAGPVPPEHWTQISDQGGGRIIGEACHFLDFATWLIGNKPQRVFAEAVTFDSVVLTIKYCDNSVASIQYVSTGSLEFPKEHIEAFAEGSAFVIHDFRWAEWAKNGRRGHCGSKHRQDKGHGAQLAAFIASLRNGTPSPVPFEEAVESTWLTFRVLESVGSGAPVNLQGATLLDTDDPVARVCNQHH